MTEEFENTTEFEKSGRDDIFSQVVKAGKRTYFFDVKATRGDELYLTITESKKRMDKDGKMYYEKHKIFLYKEDFEKFTESLNSVFDYIQSKQEIVSRTEQTNDVELTEVDTDYSSVDFDELGK